MQVVAGRGGHHAQGRRGKDAHAFQRRGRGGMPAGAEGPALAGVNILNPSRVYFASPAVPEGVPWGYTPTPPAGRAKARGRGAD